MSSTGSRFAAVDALRGLIMVIMVLDHASAYLSRQHGTEFWNGAISVYTSAFPFLTRWITHVCAPGFFFLMGAGVYWFAVSRLKSGWTTPQTVRRAAVRGLAVFLTGQLLENPVLGLSMFLKPASVSLNTVPTAMPNDGTSPYWGFVTLSGLGLVMIICALLLQLRPWAWVAIAALCTIVTNTVLPAYVQPGQFWQSLLLAPGLSQNILVMYPVIPWLAVAALGMVFAHWWQNNPDRRGSVWVVGLATLAIAVALRALGGWGNIQPARDAGWIEFLNNVKYPPSLVFWSMSLGLNLLLLSLLMKGPASWLKPGSPLMVFGQTPLFFYLAHLYLFAIAALLLFKEAAPLEIAYVGWAAALVLLYPLCARYRRFKLSKPAESAWRLF